MMMTSIVSEESLVRETHTHNTHTDRDLGCLQYKKKRSEQQKKKTKNKLTSMDVTKDMELGLNALYNSVQQFNTSSVLTTHHRVTVSCTQGKHAHKLQYLIPLINRHINFKISYLYLTYK